MSTTTLRDGFAAAPVRPSLPLPKMVGKHRVLFELGRGGMASVCLAATQGAAGVTKLVVLKTLLNELELEPDALAMFLDEARLAVQLNHGNLVQTYEITQEGDRHFIVMEYLDGQTLAHVLRRAEKSGKPLPLGLHLRILIHVLEGLHYTHELKGYDGVPLSPVHRDVSPQNVFVTFDGRTKLLDFGVAKAKTSTTHTAAGLIKGKIAYMCPEQMTGEPVDRRADVYSVGCMLWAAATGRKLWKDAEDVRILHAVLNAEIPKPTSVNPECDPELERIVMKALARAPKERYASALELQEDLERFCDAKGFQDRPRECARFVSELFADFRAQMQARIERELTVTSSGLAVARQPVAVPPLPSAVDASKTFSTAAISASTLRTSTPRPAPAKRQWVWPVVAALALAAGGYSWLSHGLAPAARATPSTPAEPLTATVVLRSSPESAQLFLDGKSIQGNPSQQALALDGAVHVLRAELAGHRAASTEFRASRDAVVQLTLEELPLTVEELPAEQARPPKVSVTPTPKKPSAKRSAGASGCAQPFFVDADGIKKIKPNCL